MKLRLDEISGGSLAKEYLIFTALEDCNLINYAVTDTTYDQSGEISNKLRNTFWFPKFAVKKGSRISLWTKAGEFVNGKARDGTPVHRFFWGLDKAIWNDSGDRAFLLYIRDFTSLEVNANG